MGWEWRRQWRCCWPCRQGLRQDQRWESVSGLCSDLGSKQDTVAPQHSRVDSLHLSCSGCVHPDILRVSIIGPLRGRSSHACPQEADACGARIEYIDQEQSVTARRISENVKLTVRALCTWQYSSTLACMGARCSAD